MPGSTLPNMGLVIPSVGGDAGTWGQENNDALTAIDAHNHTAGSGSRITTAAISIDADLSFASLYAATNLSRVQFASAAPPANNLSLFVSDGSSGLTSGELYWRNNTGHAVRFTSGNALNFASFVGGIGGDYSAVGAAENFDDSQKQYTFKDGSATWARLHAGNVRFAPFGTTSSLFIEMSAPSGIGSNYALTLPTSLPPVVPVGGSVVQVDTSGQMSFSNTFSLPITASGLITANAGLTAGANQKVRVSGTGSFPHGTFTMSMNWSVAIPATGAVYTPSVAAGLTFGASAGSGALLYIPVSLPLGKRILAARVFIKGVATATVNTTLEFITSAGTHNTIATSSTSASSATNQTLSMTGLTATVLSLGSYFICVNIVSSASPTFVLWGAEVDYDEP